MSKILSNQPASSDATTPHETAIIVAHGSPSDPDTQETVVKQLAEKVSQYLPDWQIKSATLAAPGCFEAVLEDTNNPVIYPFFMTQGWFTDTYLLKRIGTKKARVLKPTGLDPALPELFIRKLQTVLKDRAWNARDTALVVAAHGSKSAPDSSEIVKEVERILGQRLGFRTTRTGFVEQSPFLADVAKGMEQAICLPFFALRAGHYLMDIPDSLKSAEFSGPVLSPLVEHPDLPALIADALQDHAPSLQ